MTVDRAALIEAVAKAYVGQDETLLQHARPLVAAVLDQALPLIAEAIEAQQREFDTRNEGLYLAARLVRSLLGDTDGDRYVGAPPPPGKHYVVAEQDEPKCEQS